MMYFEVMKRLEYGKKVPLLDPVQDMDIESKTLKKLMESRQTIDEELQNTKIKELSPDQEHLYERKSEVKGMIKELSQSITKSSDMIMS